MNTTEAMVNGLRFSPDCEPQVIGHSKFASMIERSPTLATVSDDNAYVVRMDPDDEVDDE